MNIEKGKKKINEMTYLEMGRVYRFSPSGHPYFTDPVLNKHFMKRFKSLGGMTPGLSKSIGWNK